MTTEASPRNPAPERSAAIRRTPDAIQVRVLGRVVLSDATASDRIGRGHARELLALLVACRDEPLGTEAIIDALWPDDPPATAATIVHGHVRRLRGVFGAEAVEHDGEGYLLRLPSAAVDLWAAHDAAEARDLRAARALWDTPMFGVYADRAWARTAAERFEASVSVITQGFSVRPRRPIRPLDQFVGRHRELDTVRAALARGRLVSIVGLGGVGKTRLATEVAIEVAQALQVDLAASTGPIVARIAADLGVVATGDHHWDLRTVASVLSHGRVLLVVDGCEVDLGETASTLESLLDECPNVQVLATSRAALGVVGERVVPLLPFRDPADLRGPTIEQLCDRLAATGIDPDSMDASVLAAHAARSAGVPLAVELAVGDVLAGEMPTPARDRSAPLPNDVVAEAVEHALGHCSLPARRALHRVARLVGGFTPTTLGALAGAGSSAAGIVHELHATGLAAAFPGAGTARLVLPDAVRKVLASRPDDGAWSALSEVLSDQLAAIRPALDAPIVLAALDAGVDDLATVDALIDDLLGVGCHHQALAVATSAADAWAEAGHWTRASARLESLLGAVHPEGHVEGRRERPEQPPVCSSVAVDGHLWARGVWASSIVGATFASARDSYSRMCLAAEIAREGGDDPLARHLEFRLALGAGFGGDIAAAATHRRELGTLVDRVDSAYGRSMVGFVDALGVLVGGDPVRAGREFEAVADSLESLGAMGDAARAMRLAGLAWGRCERWNDAQQALRTADALATEGRSRGTLATIRSELVALHHRIGELDRTVVVDALDSVMAVGNLRAAGLLRLRLGVIDRDPGALAASALDLLVGDPEWARVALAELVRCVGARHPISPVAAAAVADGIPPGGSPLGPGEAQLVTSVFGVPAPDASRGGRRGRHARAPRTSRSAEIEPQKPEAPPEDQPSTPTLRALRDALTELLEPE